MAHDNVTEQPTSAHNTANNALTLSFSFIAGGGLLLMLIAMGVGVIYRESAPDILGIFFVLGLLAFVAGIAAWIALVRPFTHFDDINQPLYHGHEHPEEHPIEEDGEVNVIEPTPAEAAARADKGDSTTVINH